MPFVSISRSADPARNFAIAQSRSKGIAQGVSDIRKGLSFVFERSPRNKIRVGYSSNDFRNHPVAHLIAGLFELHDRDEFEVFAYSYGPDDSSSFRRRIEQSCDRFVDIRDFSHIDAARRIFEDKIDILVDLMGYTKNHRMQISALKPAPILTVYLGFPGTTGADFFDYILTDRLVTPEDHVKYYSEHVVHLPHCYLLNDHKAEISDKPISRRDVGLPEDAFVFCSFSQTYKIEPVMWEVWMGILRSVPGSVLWLSRGNETAQRNLKRQAGARGVDPDRIVFAEVLPKKPQHLARLRLADLFLDTRIYNAHATASDVLWAELPMITLQGSHFASRVASSILTAIGLPELITHDLDEYEALALRLARNPGELAAVGKKLSRNRLAEPLFDTPRFARNLESAYRQMWALYQDGNEPRQIEVADSGP